MRRYYILIPLMIFLGLIVSSIMSRPKSPLTFLWSKLVSRGFGASMIILLFMMCLAAFTAYKHSFSGLVTFFADPARPGWMLHFTSVIRGDGQDRSLSQGGWIAPSMFSIRSSGSFSLPVS